MLWHKSSQRLVTPKPLSARYSPSTPGKPALSGCVEQQSLKHHSHPLRRLDKLNFCSPVASSGKHRVDLKVKAVFPCVAETAVPESKEFCKTEGALASSIYGYMLTKQRKLRIARVKFAFSIPPSLKITHQGLTWTT